MNLEQIEKVVFNQEYSRLEAQAKLVAADARHKARVQFERDLASGRIGLDAVVPYDDDDDELTGEVQRQYPTDWSPVYNGARWRTVERNIREYQSEHRRTFRVTIGCNHSYESKNFYDLASARADRDKRLRELGRPIPPASELRA